jgi:hypothetical protein
LNRLTWVDERILASTGALTPMTRGAWVHPIADFPSLERIGISHSEYDTMNIFYIIGVVVVIIVVAGFLGLRV